MKPRTFFVEKYNLLDQLQKTVLKLEENYKKSEDAYNSKGYFVKNNTYHFISDLLVPENKTEKSIYDLIKQTINHSEMISGNSAQICFLFNIIFLKHLIKNIEKIENSNSLEKQKMFEDSFNKIKNIIERNTSIVNDEIIHKEIKNQTNDDVLADVIYEAIKLNGIEGKIYVENGVQENYIVEKNIGYVFNVYPFKFFLNDLNNTWNRQNVKVLIIDGMVERVSELDHLLNKSMETKTPLAIFARGFSEEVIATLKINYDKKILDVIPIKANYDLEALNILNDIASVANSGVVSAMSGDLISTTTWDNLAEVKKIRCSIQNVTIEEDKTQNYVMMHLQSIIEKRNSNLHVQDIIDLLDKRIKSLTNNITVISLPNVSVINNNSIRTKIDVSLRLIKTLTNYGIININDVVSELNNETDLFDLILKETILDMSKIIKDKNIPALSFFLGLKLAGSNCISIINSNGIIHAED